MAGHAASSMLDIVPESQAATVGSNGHSVMSSTPEVNSQTAVQYLNAMTSTSPVDTRAQSSNILESLTPTNAAVITARTVNATSRTVRWNWVRQLSRVAQWGGGPGGGPHSFGDINALTMSGGLSQV
ncbi:hypothetical protein Unana1_04609 [Umbelopsis nana]